MTFRKWFEEIAEPIVAIIVDSCDSSLYYQYDKWYGIPLNTVLTLAEFDGWLDIEFCDNYGPRGCPDIRVYTANQVYYVYEDDGSTCLLSIPRNPTVEKQ